MATLLYEPYFEPEALANLKYVFIFVVGCIPDAGGRRRRFYRYSAVDKSLIYNHGASIAFISIAQVDDGDVR